MTTNEFIKKIREADPSGTMHVRVCGNPVVDIDRKPGYWDGPYSYLEKGEDGRSVWVETTGGEKIDIETIDMSTFVEMYNGDIDEVKRHIRVEYDYIGDEKEKEFWKMVENECEEYNSFVESYVTKKRKS